MSEIRSQATPARDELAGEIGLEIMEVVVDLTGGYKPDGERDHNRIEKGARAILALLRPRTVTSAAELDALPIGSVLARNLDDPDGIDVYVKRSDLAGHRYLPTPLVVLFTPGDAG
ncbi:hypothetical protein [Rhodococcus erythropolis]|uniref:hypothetical protein n=1 Tax=Rhodococcus erythropolis TaxID=1833 RepID=UPI00366B1FE2